MVEVVKIILRKSILFGILFKIYCQLYLECWRENIMTASYNRLWKKLIDLNMSKTQLREKAGITTNAMAKMGRNENVSTEVICKICNILNCQIEDIMELVDENAEKMIVS